MSSKYLKRVSNPARNAALKVAQFANPRRVEKTKAEKRLAVRVNDYNTMTAARDHHAGASKRMSGGGYHKPGSLK